MVLELCEVLRANTEAVLVGQSCCVLWSEQQQSAHMSCCTHCRRPALSGQLLGVEFRKIMLLAFEWCCQSARNKGGGLDRGS